MAITQGARVNNDNIQRMRREMLEFRHGGWATTTRLGDGCGIQSRRQEVNHAARRDCHAIWHHSMAGGYLSAKSGEPNKASSRETKILGASPVEVFSMIIADRSPLSLPRQNMDDLLEGDDYQMCRTLYDGTIMPAAGIRSSYSNHGVGCYSSGC